MNIKRSNAFLTITFVLIVIMPLYDCLMYLLNVVHISLELRMLHLYVIILAYFIVLITRYKLPVKNMLVVLAIEVFYGISYLWTSEDARYYFLSTDVSAILFIFVPVTCLCTSRIENWKELFNKKAYLVIVDAIIIVSLLSKISFYSTSDYMSFSYGLLPLWGVCLIAAYYFGHKLQWVFLCVGAFEGLIFGSRAPIVWVIVLAFTTWLILSQNDIKAHKITHLIPAIIAVVVAAFFAEIILPRILQSSFADVSYVLRRLQGNSLLEGAGREQLYVACRKEIANMGFTVHGLFYDRTVLPNGWYAHNFVYEILLSLGWMLGIPLILFIVFFIIKTVREQNTEGKIYSSFAICVFFLRYFFSGSIFDETEFILFMTILYSLQTKYSDTLKSNMSNGKGNIISGARNS